MFSTESFLETSFTFFDHLEHGYADFHLVFQHGTSLHEGSAIQRARRTAHGGHQGHAGSLQQGTDILASHGIQLRHNGIKALGHVHAMVAIGNLVVQLRQVILLLLNPCRNSL